MTPVDFPEANCHPGPPKGYAESQVATISAYAGQIERGSMEGAPIIVTAWRPSPEELAMLNEGHPIFVSFISGGLPPHFLSVHFECATHPA
jgi:hypothetical protein